MDTSASLNSRGTGVLLLLPSVALVVLLVAMLPVIQGHRLLWFGIAGTILLLPSIVACASLRFPAALGAVAGLVYLAVWWSLAHFRLSLARAVG
jgi:hypothetical protein